MDGENNGRGFESDALLSPRVSSEYVSLLGGADPA